MKKVLISLLILALMAVPAVLEAGECYTCQNPGTVEGCCVRVSGDTGFGAYKTCQNVREFFTDSQGNLVEVGNCFVGDPCLQIQEGCTGMQCWPPFALFKRSVIQPLLAHMPPPAAGGNPCKVGP